MIISEYAQNEKNNTLAFALASMMFEPYTHVVLKMSSGGHLSFAGGGHVGDVIKHYGHYQVVRSNITGDGILHIVVKEPVN